MTQNRELCDFSNFNSLDEKENFIKDIIKKQSNLSYISVAAFHNDGVLKSHLHIMKHAEDSNFH